MGAISDRTHRLVIERAYPFEAGLEALRGAQTHHARGKRVILIE